MSKKQTTPRIQGWFEILFRNSKAPKPKCIEDFKQRDYEMHGGRMPASEYERVMDVYEMFQKRKHKSMPRGLQEFDIVTLFKVHPTHASATFVVIHRRNLRQFGYDKGTYYCAKFTEMLLIPLPSDRRFQPASQ